MRKLGESGLEAQIHLYTAWRELTQGISAQKTLESPMRGTSTKEDEGRTRGRTQTQAGEEVIVVWEHDRERGARM